MKELTNALLPSLVTSFSQYAEENWDFMSRRSAHVPEEKNKPDSQANNRPGNETTGNGARDRSGSEARWMAGNDANPFQLGIKLLLAINVVLHRKIHLGMVQPTQGQFKVVVILLVVICQGTLCLDAKVKTNDLGRQMCHLSPLL